jgi:hypothetical protein
MDDLINIPNNPLKDEKFSGYKSVSVRNVW